MNAAPEPQPLHLHELAARVSEDGVDFRLIWRPVDDGIFVVIGDPLSYEQFAFRVDPSSALDAFHHPYARQPQAEFVDAAAVL
jgi:hypothetical protein